MRSRHLDRRGYISMLHAGSVKEIAHDCARGIDSIAIGGSRSGKIELNKGAILLQEAVAVPGSVPEAAHDVGPGVQAEGKGEGSSSREVDWSKDAALPGERMKVPRCVSESAHNVSAIVDAEDERARRAGKIDLAEDAGTEQKSVRASRRVIEAAGNLSRVINTQRLSGDGAGKIDLAKSAADAVAQQAVLVTCSVSECADHVIAVVESHGLGGRGSGEIDLRERALAEKEAMLLPGMVKEKAGNISTGIDVVRLSGGAVGNVKELEVESLCRELKTREKQQGEKKLFKHNSFLSGKAIRNTRFRKAGTVLPTVPAPVVCQQPRLATGADGRT